MDVRGDERPSPRSVSPPITWDGPAAAALVALDRLGLALGLRVKDPQELRAIGSLDNEPCCRL
jgi:hypothetical protein